MIAQVQREGEFLARDSRLDDHAARRVADPEKSGESPAFGLECIDREGLVATAAWMNHMISKATFRTHHPGVDYIESQR